MKNVILIVLILIGFNSFGQQIKRSAIGAIGNTMENSSLKLNQSIGQNSVHDKHEGTSVVLRQGFQQPASNSIYHNSRLIDMHVFPNPNEGSFSVILGLDRNEEFNYEILDGQGRLISKNVRLNALQNDFTLSNATQKGTYIIRVSTKSGKVGQSKLIIL